MFRQNGFTPSVSKTNIILMNGGLGDHIASLVAINYVADRYPWITFLVWVPDYLLELSKHLLPYYVKVNNFSSMPKKYDRNIPTKTTEWDQITSPMKIHLVDYAFAKICDENPGIEFKNYLQIKPEKIDVKKFNPPKNYFVITTGYTAKVREFPAEQVNSITKQIKELGFEVVFLGQKVTPTGGAHKIIGEFDSQIDYSNGIDLIDKTTLLQAAKIMSDAKAVLGIDNGLMHLAGCTKAPIIGGFTTVSPQIRMPIRGNTLGKDFLVVVPDKKLECRFCQEKTNFLFNHDYRDCLYKDYECTKQMIADKFMECVKVIL